MAYLSNVFSSSGSITSAQIKALHGTPITIVAAPGSGKIIHIVSSFLSFKYGGTNIFTAAASQIVSIYYSTATATTTTLTNLTIVGSASKLTTNQLAISNTAITSYDNLALTLYNPVATEISGNAANDNTIEWQVIYIVATI